VQGPSIDSRYEILRQLGAGGFAEVWLAKDLATGQSVVLKRPLRSDTEALDALRHEFSIGATLDHPGIARAIDLILDPGLGGPCLVSEAVEGSPSTAARAAASHSQVLCWAVGLAETLVFLHGRGLVHGDIKPDNILISSRDQSPRLIDFGLARLIGATGGGTASTTAPEVLAGAPLAPSSDLFSLGATLYYWLFGRFPFGSKLESRLATLSRRPAIPSAGAISGGLHTLLRSLLAPEPGERPTSALMLATQLAALGARVSSPRFIDPEARAQALPLIGRERALARLQPACSGVQQVRAFQLDGPPGAGHSRILGEVARQARLAGRRVIRTQQLSAAQLGALVDGHRVTIVLDRAGAKHDELTRLALQQLASWLGHARDAVLVFAGDGDVVPGAEQIGLDRLEAQHVSEIVSALLPGAWTPDALARRLARESDGLPGRIVNALIAAVRVGYAVDRGLGGWDLSILAQRPTPSPGRPSSAAEREAAFDTIPAEAELVLALLAATRGPLLIADLIAASALSAEAIADATRWLLAHRLVISSANGSVDLRHGTATIPKRSLSTEHRERLIRVLARRRPTGGRDLIAPWLATLARCVSSTANQRLAGRLFRRAVSEALICGKPDLAAELLTGSSEYDDPIAAAWILDARAEIWLAQGRADLAADAFQQAAELFERSGRLDSASLAWSRTARSLGQSGSREPAKTAAARSLALARNARARGHALYEQGVLAAIAGEYAESLDRFERALDLAEPDELLARRTHAARARCLVLLGRWDDAEADFRSAERAAIENQDEGLMVAMRLARIQAALKARRPSDALTLAAQSRTELTARGDADGLALLASIASDAAGALGEWEQALREAESALRWREVDGRPQWIGTAALRLARLVLLLGDLRRARALIDRALAAFGEQFEDRAEAHVLAARLAAIESDPAAAREAVVQLERFADAKWCAIARAWHSIAERNDSALTAGLAGLESVGTLHPEAAALAALALAQADPERARTHAIEAQSLAERESDFDSALLAMLAEERACRRASLQVEVARVRSALQSRLRDAAHRLKSASLRSSFLDRPDRRALLESQEVTGDAQRLAALYNVVAELNLRRDPEAVITTLLDRALETIGAERGAVILLQDHELRVIQARGVEPQTAADAVSLSRTILSRAKGGESVLTVDPAHDPRFTESRSVAIFAIRAVLCVPLQVKNRIVGALYLDSRDPQVRFTATDLAFAEALAHHAALALETAREFRRLLQEIEDLRAEVGRTDQVGPLIGRSAAMREAIRMIRAVAPTHFPVLICGESGTGKKIAARQIHRLGPKPEGPFVRIGSESLPSSIVDSTLFGHQKGAFTSADRSHTGLLAEAHGGTLFLDEVGELAVEVQSKLLTVLESRCVVPIGSNQALPADFRLICATKHDLEELTVQGKLRREFLYRIRVLTVQLPPLRERLEDIPEVATQLLHRLMPTPDPYSIEPALLELLRRWSWPGNVRELESVLTRLVMLATGPVLTVETLRRDPQLAEQFRQLPHRRRPLKWSELERDAIRQALIFHGGNRELAAQELGMSRATIFRKIREYDLENAGRSPDPTSFGPYDSP
jgi:Nif-specific regulatory protein